MSQLLFDNRKQDFVQELNFQILKNFGSRLTVKSVQDQKDGKYDIYFNYNKIFNVIDESTKTVYVRNIFLQDIYSAELKFNEQVKLPIREINKAIADEFIDLRNDLFQEVISDKTIVLKILTKIHTTSAFLNKFYTILNELFCSDNIPQKTLNSYLKSDLKFQKYIDLIIDTKLANLDKEGNLKASNKFKKLLEENKSQPTNAINESIFKIIRENYDYVVYELGLRHIKAYVNIVACLYYLSKYSKLKNVSISFEQLFMIYENIFGSTSYGKFREKVNSLVISGIFIRSNNSIRLTI